jgi:ELWxxDGT repeat protein
LVRDIRSGSTGSFPSALLDVNGVVNFSAATGASGYEVFRSNGTSAGTFLLYDANPGSAHGNPWSLSVDGDVLTYLSFVATGTIGIVVRTGTTLRTLLWGPGLQRSSRVAAVGGRIVFTAVEGSNYSLYSSDGTVSGTQRLAVPGYSGGFLAPPDLVRVGGHIYFRMYGTSGCCLPRVFTTDGTIVTQVFENGVGPGDITNTTEDLRAYGNELVFWYRTVDPTTGDRSYHLHLGAAGGSVLLGGHPSTMSYPYPVAGTLTVAGRSLYVRMQTGPSSSTLACWTPTNGLTSVGNRAHPVAPVGDRIFFNDTDTAGAELWITDGTPAGTRFVADIRPGPDSSSPGPAYRPSALSSRYALFVASDGIHGRELWISDGTAAGTRMLHDLEPGIGDIVTTIGDGGPVLAGGTAFVSIGDAALGTELYAIELGATAQPLSGGCARPTDPLLRATDPVLGTSLALIGDRAPSSMGVVLIGSQARPGQPYAPGCRLLVDLSLPFIDVFVFATAGAFGLTIPLPNDPGLNDVLLGMQAGFADATAPLGISLSNAVLLRLGR